MTDMNQDIKAIQDKLHEIGVLNATIFAKLEAIERRAQDDRDSIKCLTQDIKNVKEKMEVKFEIIESRINILKDDLEKRFGDIKSTLAKYSVFAAIAMTAIFTIVKNYLEK